MEECESVYFQNLQALHSYIIYVKIHISAHMQEKALPISC